MNRQLAKDLGNPSRHNSQPAGADVADRVSDVTVMHRKTAAPHQRRGAEQARETRHLNTPLL